MFYLHLFFLFSFPFPFVCLTHIICKEWILINSKPNTMICHMFDLWLWIYDHRSLIGIFDFHNFVHFFLHLELRPISWERKRAEQEDASSFQHWVSTYCSKWECIQSCSFSVSDLLILGVPCSTVQTLQHPAIVLLPFKFNVSLPLLSLLHNFVDFSRKMCLIILQRFVSITIHYLLYIIA